jgi:hypothetical protein
METAKRVLTTMAMVGVMEHGSAISVVWEAQPTSHPIRAFKLRQARTKKSVGDFRSKWVFLVANSTSSN